jgi:hypothetical protein
MHVKALMSGIFTCARREDAVREANPERNLRDAPEASRTSPNRCDGSGLRRIARVRDPWLAMGKLHGDRTARLALRLANPHRTHQNQRKRGTRSLSFRCCAALSTSIGCAILAMALSLPTSVREASKSRKFCRAYLATTETPYIVVDRSEANKAMKKLERAVGKKWQRPRRMVQGKSLRITNGGVAQSVRATVS